ncbi:hypothetical protein [Paraburkholderia phytofirmans]|uniref:Peptidase C1A papain n=1 Tax=Paraburkholderia phytofirmans (strain DSM 17436 / LMG 22146 / PsJN) TaxID=398527 RepID=B2T8L5_PARPJ|nr:hypothetical protein [Paraburkholderia phytofirmans]ACD20678.1 hypothetical protein Bphyt_6354 [Paraburkholderia phytofirmans PsJN]
MADAIAQSGHATFRLPHFTPVMLDPTEHRTAIETALELAERAGLVSRHGPTPMLLGTTRPRSWSLAADQTPFKNQSDRGTCWAFAGASALEAAYHRRFGLTLDLSEEYVFHMGKAFALNRTTTGLPAQPVENNSSLTGFQGSGDIAQKLSENAVPDETVAPYLTSQGALTGILPTLGYAGVGALVSQEDFDALEFCEQHVPLIARVNCRYRATGFASIGGTPSIEALENVILSNHEVICDVQHLTAPAGGHVLTLIGFDSDRKVFTAKNHWGENAFIEIAYQSDPNWQILSGWYITDVVDPTFVQNQACWLGNWHVKTANGDFRLLLRRSEDFAAPGQPTRLGHAYLADGRHDVNGHFSANGQRLTAFIASGTGATMPGTETGTKLEADLDFADVYEQFGTMNGPVELSRFNTRFAALFVPDGGETWQARHGIDAAAYQNLFDTLPGQGFRPAFLGAYSEGRGTRFNAVWLKRDGPLWAARHGLTAAAYQVAFDQFVADGFHPVVVSGYAENGEDRYAALFEQGSAPEWHARHGLLPNDYQSTFDALSAAGFVPVQVCGYRVNVGLRFAAIWQKLPGIEFIGRHNLTASQYQTAFDDALARGFRLVCVNGYSNSGIANYAAIWHRGGQSVAWQARHGVDAAGYQRIFDELATRGMRPAVVSGYGDGFYPA